MSYFIISINKGIMKRHTEEHKQEILEYYKIHSRADTNRKYKLAPNTLYIWSDPEFYKTVKAATKKWKQGAGKVSCIKQHIEYHKKNPDYDLIHKRKYLKNIHNLKNKREREKKYHHYKMKTDINYRLRKALRNRVNATVLDRGWTKSVKTLDLVGCTIKHLKEHLQKQFIDNMSWDNYGEWHIDHIKPCAAFNLEDPIEQKVCFHYSNLQPLWAVDNFKKHDKIIESKV